MRAAIAVLKPVRSTAVAPMRSRLAKRGRVPRTDRKRRCPLRRFLQKTEGFVQRKPFWRLAVVLLAFGVGADARGDSDIQARPDRAAAGHFRTGGCGAAHTRIAAVQGRADTSPLAGDKVNVEAIVTAVLQGDTQLRGYFIQQADSEFIRPADRAGARPASRGLFVYDRRSAVRVGDRLRVSAVVAEHYGLTELKPFRVVVCAGAQPLPAAMQLRLPLAARDDLEAFESMRVMLPQRLTVNATRELGRYGQILLAAGRRFAPTQVAAPGAPARALRARNALNQLLLDDGSDAQYPDPIVFPAPALSAANTVRNGDTVTHLDGVLYYAFGAYRVVPTAAPVFGRSNPRPAAPALPAAKLRVAAFNVLNFFNGDGRGGGFPGARGADSAAEFSRQRAKTVSAIRGLNADIVGLSELENDGYGPRSAIAQLVAALNAAGGNYAFIDPGADRIGGDAIAVGFLYRRDRVAPQGAAALLDRAVDPRFGGNRPALAQTFRDRAGAVLTVVMVHLRSKRSDCGGDRRERDSGDGQGDCSPVRTRAAQALTAWLATDPTGSGDDDYLIIGDLNAYAREDPLRVIAAAGYTDLAAQFGGAGVYSYIFDGQAGTLDYALASASLLAQVRGAAHWHINADEPAVLDYNTERKSARQIAALYAPDAYRSADHDPLVVALDLLP
jgi:predicted extracellular nuclease